MKKTRVKVTLYIRRDMLNYLETQYTSVTSMTDEQTELP